MVSVVTRQEAKERGAKRYFTGVPCKRGHLSERGTASRACIQCSLSWEKNWRKMNQQEARSKDRKRHTNRAQQETEYRKTRRLLGGDQLRAKDRALYAKNPDWFREKWKRYHQTHRQDLIAKHRSRYASNKEEQVARVRRWQLSHPETMRVIWRNRHSRKKGACGSHSRDDIVDIREMQRGRCAYCKCDVGRKYHVDHIVALANGGANHRRNLQILCPSCNMSKHTKDPIVYSRSLGLLI